MKTLTVATLLLSALASSRAVAQERHVEVAAGAQIATGPTAPPAQQVAKDDYWVRFQFKIDGGVAIIPSETVGGFARLGGDAMLSKDPERARFVWGVWDAYEGWIASEAGGFAIPIEFFVGYRQAPFVATLGGGFNLLTIDDLDHDTGVGIFSPRGGLRAGLDLGGVTILATSDIGYRWMWGRDDISMLQLGLMIGIGPPFQH
jgi:hypothetical protein